MASLIVRNAGKDSVMSLKFILMIEEIMNKPTMIRAGAVAEAGTIRNSGDRNNAITNINAVLTAVKPVLPPEATPAQLST